MAHEVEFVNGKPKPSVNGDKPKNGTEDDDEGGILQRIIRKLKHETDHKDKKRR